MPVSKQTMFKTIQRNMLTKRKLDELHKRSLVLQELTCDYNPPQPLETAIHVLWRTLEALDPFYKIDKEKHNEMNTKYVVLHYKLFYLENATLTLLMMQSNLSTHFNLRTLLCLLRYIVIGLTYRLPKIDPELLKIEYNAQCRNTLKGEQLSYEIIEPFVLLIDDIRRTKLKTGVIDHLHAIREEHKIDNFHVVYLTMLLYVAGILIEPNLSVNRSLLSDLLCASLDLHGVANTYFSLNTDFFHQPGAPLASTVVTILSRIFCCDSIEAIQKNFEASEYITVTQKRVKDIADL